MKKLILILVMLSTVVHAQSNCEGRNKNKDASSFSKIHDLATLPIFEKKHPAAAKKPAQKLQENGEEFPFPVTGLEPQEGFEFIHVIKSSPNMNQAADEILLNCQGFIAEIAFYNRAQNGPNGAPVETYTMDHHDCYEVTEEIKKFLSEGKTVCITLDLEQYNKPKVEDKACEAPVQ
jgi:hypothetical protein